MSFAQLSLATLGTGPDISAVDLARAVAEFGILHFGSVDAAVVALARMRLCRGEQLGSAVFTLVDHGVITPSPNDRRSDFDGLYTFESLFEGW